MDWSDYQDKYSGFFCVFFFVVVFFISNGWHLKQATHPIFRSLVIITHCLKEIPVFNTNSVNPDQTLHSVTGI